MHLALWKMCSAIRIGKQNLRQPAPTTLTRKFIINKSKERLTRIYETFFFLEEIKFCSLNCRSLLFKHIFQILDN